MDYQAQAITEAERKKIYWRNQITGLERRLAAVPDPDGMDDDAPAHLLAAAPNGCDLLSAMGYERGGSDAG